MSRFKQIMVAVNLYDKLKSAKKAVTESFNDVIQRLLNSDNARDISWSLIKPTDASTREFYGSELFA